MLLGERSFLWSRDRAGNIWENSKRNMMPMAKDTSKFLCCVENPRGTQTARKGRLCEHRKEILPRDLMMSGQPVYLPWSLKGRVPHTAIVSRLSNAHKIRNIVVWRKGFASSFHTPLSCETYYCKSEVRASVVCSHCLKCWEGSLGTAMWDISLKPLIQGTELGRVEGRTGSWHECWSYFASSKDNQVFLQ